jgi:type II secretory pathway component PulJ
MSVEDRIDGLIALAGSDNANEARNAAHAACALMRKHGIKAGARPAQQSRQAYQSSFEARLLRELQNRVRDLEAQLQQAKTAANASRDHYTRAREGAAKEERPPMITYRCFASRYDGACNVCRGRYMVGDLVWWRKGSGARHTECHKAGENDE